MFNKKMYLSVCFAVVFSIIFSIISFAKTSESIRGEVLRLHVIANSDSSSDQNLKIRVRDAVLKSGADIFDGSVTSDDAIDKITPKIPELERIARKVIEKYGKDYGVKIKVCKDYFPTKTYDTVTLPAGKYMAVKVIIGSGNGHNWWCVMFPSMCLPAAKKTTDISDVLDSKEIKLVEKNPRIEPRFKIIEIIEAIKNK